MELAKTLLPTTGQQASGPVPHSNTSAPEEATHLSAVWPRQRCIFLGSILTVGTMGVVLPSETKLGRLSAQCLVQRRGSRTPGFLPFHKSTKHFPK